MAVSKILLGSLFLGVALATPNGKNGATLSDNPPPFVTSNGPQSRDSSRCQPPVVAPCMDPSDLLPLGPGSIYEVASPNFPKKYPHNAGCWRQFTVQANTALNIQCADFNVNGGNNCQKDFVGLYWGIGDNTQTNYCGDGEALKEGLRTEAFAEDYEFWFDFTSDKRGKAIGFKCYVIGEAEDGGPSLTTAAPTEPTTAGPTGPTGPTTAAPTTTAGPSDCECGLQGAASRSLQHIVGGEAADKNEYPWQVALIRPGSVNFVFCGGTIINKRFVMTAAHCTGGSAGNINVKVGEWNLSNNNDGAKVIKVKKIHAHPQYGINTDIDMDFSILELKEDLEFSESVRPACLPQSDITYAGVDAVVSGWGTLSSGGSSPNKLQEVTVQVTENANCGNYPQNEITANMMCAGTEGKDSCQGDSGGPLVTKVSNRYHLVGVVSWGYGCAAANYPGVYARITKVLDWINTTISAGNTCYPA